MTFYSWSYFVLKTVGNTGCSLILLWHYYLSIYFSDTATWKSKKSLNTKNSCKMKNIWLVCKELQYSIIFYSFSTTSLKFICSFKNSSLVSLSESDPFGNQKTRSHFCGWSTILLFTSFSKTLLTTERRLTGGSF